MKFKLYILITFVITSFSVNAQIDRSKQPQPGPAPKINLQKPLEFQLANGLTVMVVENKKLPRVSYQLRIDNVPSLDGDKAGVSSILGAMLGNGTSTISKDDFNDEVDFLGANINFGGSSAFASGLSKYSDRILELMADAAINPLLVEEEFQKEKDKQIEGLKSNEKSIDAIASRVGNALSYGTHHPYGEYISQETLNNITLEDVKTYYIEQFNPGNAYLVVIGDVNPNNIKSEIESTFGPWIKGTGLNEGMPEAHPNVQYQQINFVDMPDATQSDISITNNIQLKMSDPDYHATLIASYILGGGGSAYLYKNLRETHGYTYGSYSNLSSDKYVSKFRAYAKVRNEVTDSSVVEILNEIKRIKTETVTPETLEKAKALYSGSFVRALEQPQTIARYALNIKINDLSEDYYATYLQKINAVTADDVKRIANKYFKPDNARIIIIGKGSDVLGNLEKTGIPIKYFDTYANAVEKPEFSKPIPTGVTTQTVMDAYFNAVGGKEKASGISTVHSIANVTIEGAPFKPSAELKQMTPNKESMEMSIEGMGTIVKQKFNGEGGYNEQQGIKTELTAEEVAEKKSEHTIFPELHYDMANVSLEAVTTIEGKDVYKVKVMKGNKDTFRYYDAESGLLVRTETPVEAQGQSMTSVTDLGNYSEVNGVKFPYFFRIKAGPQVISMNVSNVKVNEGVTDADFD
ncbi:MAG: insulinase family protein [Flavobacteriaceae bacterium]|nr:insulinase family protein [Flavobacteriaceae bacterium]